MMSPGLLQLVLVWLIPLLAVSPARALQNEPPPQGGEGAPRAAAQVGDPANAEELLDRLEQSERTLENFQAGIHRRVFDATFEESQVSIGDIYFDMNRAGGGRRFAILFKRKGTLVEVDGGPPAMNLRDKSDSYIFDGQWLVEKDIEGKQFIKRRMARPGEKFDPLSLDGPLPMPLGQPKSDVLRLFEVELVQAPAAETFLAAQLKNVWGLKLTPRPGTRGAEQFETVTVFYDRETLLPAGIDARKPGGNRDMIWLFRQRRNEGFDPSLVDVAEPTEPGWKIDRRDWQEDPTREADRIARSTAAAMSWCIAVLLDMGPAGAVKRSVR